MMKTITSWKIFWCMALLYIGLGMTACEPNTRQEANRDYNELKTWVEQNSERAETATQDEWNEMKTEFDSRAAKLDSESTAWDEEARQKWEQVKTQWQETENKVEARFRTDDMGGETDTLE